MAPLPCGAHSPSRTFLAARASFKFFLPFERRADLLPLSAFFALVLLIGPTIAKIFCAPRQELFTFENTCFQRLTWNSDKLGRLLNARDSGRFAVTEPKRLTDFALVHPRSVIAFDQERLCVLRVRDCAQISKHRRASEIP